jgi:hypothetical protein
MTDVNRPLRRRIGAIARLTVRRVIDRERVDDLLDWARMKIDVWGAADYQPVSPAEPAGAVADRAVGTLSRWSAIEPVVEELSVRSAVDIGCNVGWFARSLAERGIATVGVESHPPLYRTAMYVARKYGGGHMTVLPLTVSPDTVALVPHTDCTVFLAVWHHIVRYQGRNAADTVLRRLWSATGRVLFFETGEAGEMPESYGLPQMAPNPRAWLEDYLRSTCEGAELRHLGLHPSSASYRRNLFAVVRA